MPNAFRFGVQAQGAYTADEWRKKAYRCESMGYSSLLIPDHLDVQWGPLVAMTVAAEATERLHIGTSVLCNDFRNPVVLAKELATLDLVAGAGRLEVGIGAGWRAKDYRAAGVEFARPGVRIDRLAASIDVLTDIWRDARSHRVTGSYQIAADHGQPRPLSQPRPAIMVGGGGRRILTLAAEKADIVGIAPKMASGGVRLSAAKSLSAEAFDERVNWVASAAKGRADAVELQCLALTCRVTTDRRASLTAFATGSGIDPDEFGAAPSVLVGSVEQICDQLIERRERWGLTYWVINEQAMSDFEPVVARLAGRTTL